jgi:hypothetical protein
MGLFDKLFGKKGGAETGARAPLSATDSAAEIPPSDDGITDIQTS